VDENIPLIMNREFKQETFAQRGKGNKRLKATKDSIF
jgi:hypothetical protein